MCEVFPTFESEKEVFDFMKTQFPKHLHNSILALLAAYKNTIIKG